MAVEDAAPPLPLDAPVAVVCGHYGVGKTNLTLNIALDAAAAGRAVTVIDLDVVNPFFRSSDYRALLDERGIRRVAPVFAGTNVDLSLIHISRVSAFKSTPASTARSMFVCDM